MGVVITPVRMISVFVVVVLVRFQVVVRGGVIPIGGIGAEQPDVDTENEILQKQTNRFEEDEEEENTHQVQ